MRTALIILCMLCAGRSLAQLTYQTLYVDYDSAVTFKNLRLIPIRYKGGQGGDASPAVKNMVSLNKALQQGLVTVQERGTTAIENVHWLSLYNNSDKDIFVSSGEVLEGGRQDRMVSRDTVVAAKSGRVDLPVMCVEEGRWSEKDHKFAYKRMANTRLRKTLDQTRSQVQVWREIDTQLDRGKIKSKTLAYLSREKNKAYTQLQLEYWQFFQKRLGMPDSNVTGIVCMSGDSILGSDIFISPRLFYENLQPLLLGYIEEAMLYGGPPAVPDKRVHAYLDLFLPDEALQEAFVQKNGKQYKSGGKVIHLTTY